MARGPRAAHADLLPDELVAAVERLLGAASRKLAVLTEPPVTALAIAGMGETGCSSTEGEAAPGLAWFDPRGTRRSPPARPTAGTSSPARTGSRSARRSSVARLLPARQRP